MASGSARAVSVRSKLIVNSILAIAFVAISAPQATRIPAHEWISLAFIGILAVHLLFSWTWIVGVGARLLSALRGQVRFNFVLDVFSYLAMVAVIVSGIVISESALPSLGLPRVHDRFWAVIHDRASEFLLILIGTHLAMHWDWIVAALGRLFSGRLGQSVAHERRGSWTRPVMTLTAVSLVAAAVAIAVGRSSYADGFRRPGEGARARAERAAKPRENVLPGVAAANDSLAATRDRGEGDGGERRGANGQRRESGERGARGDREGGVGERERGQRTGGQREGGGNQLGWRQRYLRPAIKIATFMGVPFLVTLVVSSLATRARPNGGRVAPADPLEQRID